MWGSMVLIYFFFLGAFPYVLGFVPHHIPRSWIKVTNVPLLRSQTSSVPVPSSPITPDNHGEESNDKGSTTRSKDSDPSHHGQQQRRILGSQELLMAPRQYQPGNVTFPPVNHVSCAIWSATPDPLDLERAIDFMLQSHPLLRATIEGGGEPDRRIDLFQMVRQGNPDPLTFVTQDAGVISAKDIITVVNVGESPDALDRSWQSSFAKNLDGGFSAPIIQQGPLWKLELHRTTSRDAPCAVLLSFNHAISDQSSANRMIDQILRRVVDIEEGRDLPSPIEHNMPVTLEESVLGPNQRWSDVSVSGVSLGTIKYVLGKAGEGLRNPVILPDSSTGESASSNAFGAFSIISGSTAGGRDDQSRRSIVEFRTLPKDVTNELARLCRKEGISMTNALTAALTLSVSDFIDSGVPKSNKHRNYKVLQSLDMRRFGAKLDQGNTVSCMASSMDLMHGPIADRSGELIRGDTLREKALFWRLAREGRQQTLDFVNRNGPQDAVRVFDFAMTVSDLNNLVHLTAQSKDTKGRAYSAGLTNAGVYEKLLAFSETSDLDRSDIRTQYGRFKVSNIFYATPHVQSGCLFPLSCITVDGALSCTFHPVSPIVDEETNHRFANAFMELLNSISGAVPPANVTDFKTIERRLVLPENSLTIAALVLGFISVLSHSSGWTLFFQSILEMKGRVDDPSEFWPAINFWIFFAAAHPILKPILYLSDLLHGSPGPKIGGLVPASFVAGNMAIIYALQRFKDLRNAVNVAALSAFLSYVGAGLEGTANLGDYNLALDDSYRGEIVRGCPAYQDVRQPSMEGFELNKYQGLWYEHKFHDWTQFTEVYDTALSIKLTEGGKGWVDDFSVKGPAPDAAPLSWWASPVANGAHYFMFGRVDPTDPPGVLREKGFGVEFPNYIVDVKTDPVTGEYQEAIQFQCLERGGIRIFEGINFMSRKSTMSDEELQAMHARAEKAGMYPYGASPDQMHTIAHRRTDIPKIDNEWQKMWSSIGFDKVLELLAESIEDDKR